MRRRSRTIREEEAWAAACIEAVSPDTRVDHHDDGSRPSMYDLSLVRDNIRIGACEVTSAADPQLIELWKLANGSEDTHIEHGLDGGWLLSLKPNCRVKKLKAQVRSVLEDLEDRQISYASRTAAPLGVEQTLKDLDISYVRQSGTDFPGSVYFTIDQPSEMTRGIVPKTGDSLCIWLESWIAGADQEHNITKLADSRTPEKHLFVLVPSFSKAPFAAADVLMRNAVPLPTRPPNLPKGLTHIWVMSTWSCGDVVAWAPDRGWTRYEKTFTVPEHLA